MKPDSVRRTARDFATCACVLAAALAACHSAPRSAAPAATTHTAVAAPPAWPLLPPASLGAARAVTQTLRAEFRGQRLQLQCAVRIDTRELTVIGITPTGQRAYTLRYDGSQLHEERAPQVPAAMTATQLLNDLQLAFWPLAALQRAWAPAGGVVLEPAAGHRQLLRNGTLLVEVDYPADPWRGTVRLHHHDQPYSLTIDSQPL